MKIEFYFKADELQRWLRALRNLAKQAKQTEKKLPFEGALAYRNQVLQNLSHQRFGWARHSQAYAEWKSKYGYPSKKWEMTGELIRAIKVFRATDSKGKKGWMGGVDPKIYTSKIGWSNKPRGSIQVLQYAVWVEEGTSKMPPRPLFMPTAEDYAERHWPLLAAKHHARIGSYWR